MIAYLLKIGNVRQANLCVGEAGSQVYASSSREGACAVVYYITKRGPVQQHSSDIHVYGTTGVS